MILKSKVFLLIENIDWAHRWSVTLKADWEVTVNGHDDGGCLSLSVTKVFWFSELKSIEYLSLQTEISNVFHSHFFLPTYLFSSNISTMVDYLSYPRFSSLECVVFTFTIRKASCCRLHELRISIGKAEARGLIGWVTIWKRMTREQKVKRRSLISTTSHKTDTVTIIQIIFSNYSEFLWAAV